MHDKCSFLLRIAGISNDFSYINFIKLSRKRFIVINSSQIISLVYFSLHFRNMDKIEICLLI